MRKLRKLIFLSLTLSLAITVVFTTSYVSTSYAKKINELLVFGDSLSETGNLYFAGLAEGLNFPESPPYDTGRFSNGLVWVEYLALSLNLTPPLPSNVGGTNYSWGGAETGDGISARGTPNIGEQIYTFLFGPDPTSPNYPNENQLIVIWAGSNDFNNSDTIPPDPQNLVDNIIEHIKTLAFISPEEKLQFLVPNLPPLGQTARAQCLGQYDPSIPLILDGLSAEFNFLLFKELKKVKKELKNEYSIKVKIFRLDIYSLTKEILNDPASFGFTNVSDTARIGTDDFGCPLDVTAPNVGVVVNPNEYLFFDDVHPTTTFHKAVADRALELIDD
jgi:3-phytase